VAPARPVPAAGGGPRTSRAHPVEGAGSSDRPHQGSDRTVGLRVDVDTYIRPAHQHIGEQRDRGPSRRCGTYLSPGQRPNLTGPVGHPVQPVVVEDDQDVGGGHVNVGLEVAVAQLDGPCERGHRVLPPIERPATVGDRQRPVVLKERMGHDSSFPLSSCADRHGVVRVLRRRRRTGLVDAFRRRHRHPPDPLRSAGEPAADFGAVASTLTR
jgi:hypothetical protein